MKQSAGVLVYRCTPQLEVLIGHPGGPFWSRRHEGVWSIIKGEMEGDEDPEAAARREFQEETGVAMTKRLEPLGVVTQKAGKVVFGFAAECDLAADELVSNLIDIEWPPRSGRSIRIPEIDCFAWFGVDEASVALNPAQVVFLERLESLLRS